MRAMVMAGVGLAALVAVPAMAMDRYGAITPGQHATIADPDAALDRLADASTAADQGHAKPAKSARSILRNDPYLRSAFAWLDNK